MANPEHLALIKRINQYELDACRDGIEQFNPGITEFNRYRQDHPDEIIDLSRIKTYKVYGTKDSETKEVTSIGIIIRIKLDFINLSRADLYGVDMCRASLIVANLQEADMREGKFRHCKFINANLRRAKLSNTDLRGADFTGADLRGADLFHADITGADFTHANMEGANFTNTYFHGTYHDKADLFGVKGLSAEIRLAYLQRLINSWT